MSGIPAMPPSEGAALRYQLTGLLRSLSAYEQPLDETGDQDAADLVAAVRVALSAAVKIENRGTRATANRGVRLIKR